jgi:hypothetical protein
VTGKGASGSRARALMPFKGTLRLSPNIAPSPSCSPARSIPMLDVIVLAVGLGFFALSVGYTIACDRL